MIKLGVTDGRRRSDALPIPCKALVLKFSFRLSDSAVRWAAFAFAEAETALATSMAAEMVLEAKQLKTFALYQVEH